MIGKSGCGAQEGVCAALDSLRVVLARWPLLRLSDEMDSLSEILSELSKLVFVWDRAMWNDAYEKLKQRRESWADHLITWEKGEGWPPRGAIADADTAEHESECALYALMSHVMAFVEWTKTNVRNQTEDFREQNAKLETRTRASQRHAALRHAILEESHCAQRLLRCELLPPTEEFLKFASGQTCALGHVRKFISLWQASTDMCFTSDRDRASLRIIWSNKTDDT